MLFNSFTYLIFLALVVVLYWVVPYRFRRFLLLVASYIFYMSWMPQYGLLIFGLTVANYFIGLWLVSTAHRKPVLVLAVTVNLGVLAFFKYAGFVMDNALNIVGLWDPAVTTSWTMKIILPLGISFFTFEFIHYTVDVYRGSPPIRSFLDLALFPAFFPTQIAGPIKRYQNFIPQLQNLPQFENGAFQTGCGLIVRGLFKKVVLADNLAPVVTQGFSGFQSLGFIDAWVTIVGFAFQIYFDFSGYTDIGRGSALLMGFKVPENFNLPYLAASIAEFWRSWHITLSSWLRDYAYIPLGGSRGTERQTYRNLFITMALGGLWHGASWTFVIWGMYHGVLLILHRMFSRLDWPIIRQARHRLGFASTPLSILLTFVAVCFGYTLFRAGSVTQAVQIMLAMIGLGNGVYGDVISKTKLFEVALIAAGWLAFVLVVQWLNERSDRPWQLRTRWALLAAYYAAMMAAVVVLQPTSSAAFIYFQF